MRNFLPPPILIAGLTTALVVGGYMHISITADLMQQIEDLQAIPSQLAPDSISEFQEFVASLEPTPIQEEAAPDNWIYGSLNARFTLVEMTDTECPYCSQHFPILKSMIDSSAGQINAALLHVPALSEASRQQALAIECAGEQGGSESAWKYAQLVFDNTGGNGKGVATSLSALASTLQLDASRFSRCMDSVEVAERVMADMEQAIRLDIKQTPSTMVVDNITGKSIVLQGTNASQDGIFGAMEKISQAGGAAFER